MSKELAVGLAIGLRKDTIMAPCQSSDITVEVIANLIVDISTLCIEWFPPSAARKTERKFRKRVVAEGIGFMTKTMPRLGKSLDRALAGDVPLDRGRFAAKQKNSKLPKFLGELFERIFADDGWVLPNPNVYCIRIIRQVLYVAYKYEIPYEKRDEDRVLLEFENTENQIVAIDSVDQRGCVVAGQPVRDACLPLQLLLPDVVWKSPLNAETTILPGQQVCQVEPGQQSADGFRGNRPNASNCGSGSLYVRDHSPARLLPEECCKPAPFKCRACTAVDCPFRDTSSYAQPELFRANGSGWCLTGAPGRSRKTFVELKSLHCGPKATDQSLSGFLPSGSPNCSGQAASANAETASPCSSKDEYRSMDLSIAKSLLRRLLCNFDPLQITPRHGPGAVSTGEKCWEKMLFKRFYPSLNDVFPYADYFYVSPSHVHDAMQHLRNLPEVPEGMAKVCLVPKDSRGPRLISCEPLEIQWIQQGVFRALVSHIEHHTLTRGAIWFTAQLPNREAARMGSISGGLSTLDLKEASDRVSLAIVRELFPEHVYRALVAARSSSTRLPDGRILKLKKYAPMGSALCFPVMALTIWALTVARQVRKTHCSPLKVSKKVLVFGDDVIVPTPWVTDTMEVLESVGLMINRSKSYYTGHFRESCGLDAYLGEEVQPVRIKTVWSSRRTASAYTSWIEYGNSLHRAGYVQTAQLIAASVIDLYGPVPFVKEGNLGYPAFVFDTYASHLVKRRWDANLHRFRSRVWVCKPKRVQLDELVQGGWGELLRYLTQGGGKCFAAGSYTPAKQSILCKVWR